MTLTFIAIDRYNVIVFPLDPSRSTTNNRSRIMILLIWIYSVPFAGKLFQIDFTWQFYYLNSLLKIIALPVFEIWGVRGYIPEGFLTACSFDYLDTTSSNYWFIMIYAIVRAHI